MRSLRPLGDPPLVPSGDQGRSELRRELLLPQYHRQDTLQQIVDWVQRRLQSGLDAAHDAPPLSTLAAMLVFVALLAALVALVSRARRTATAAHPAGAVLTEEVVTAAELRDRAGAAYAEGRYADAVVDGFRALTLQQVEHGVLFDNPGATAREVAAALGTQLGTHPGTRPGTQLATSRSDIAARVSSAADRFDAVRYGDRPAGRDEAATMLSLDAELAGSRRGARR